MVLGILIFAFAPQVASFFVPGDRGVIADAAYFLRVIALAWGFMGIQLALIGVLRASGNMVTAMTITLASQWVIQFPVAYILATHTKLGASGIWWAFPVNNVLTALIVLGVYARGNWKHTRLIRADDKAAARVSKEAELEEAIH
jgi:Na+-driven multidrug efflux pump